MLIWKPAADARFFLRRLRTGLLATVVAPVAEALAAAEAVAPVAEAMAAVPAVAVAEAAAAPLDNMAAVAISVAGDVLMSNRQPTGVDTSGEASTNDDPGVAGVASCVGAVGAGVGAGVAGVAGFWALMSGLSAVADTVSDFDCNISLQTKNNLNFDTNKKRPHTHTQRQTHPNKHTHGA